MARKSTATSSREPDDLDGMPADRRPVAEPPSGGAEDDERVGEVDEDEHRERGHHDEQHGVVQLTCDVAGVVPLPGGMFGPSTNTTSGSTIAVATTVERGDPGGVLVAAHGAPSDDIDEAVHVADRLHRAAEAEKKPAAQGTKHCQR